MPEEGYVVSQPATSLAGGFRLPTFFGLANALYIFQCKLAIRKDILSGRDSWHMPPGNETAVSIILCQDHLLLLKRKERSNDPWSGDMCFPGGFVKDGETPLMASIRELKEETGIDRDSITFKFEHKIFHPVRSSSINVHTFVFQCSEMIPVEPDSEIERGGWYRIGTEINECDDRKGDFIRWNGDIVWGLTYRIYESLRDAFKELEERH